MIEFDHTSTGTCADASTAEFYVLSERTDAIMPAIGCLIEFEDVLCSTLDAELIAPRSLANRSIATRIAHKLRPVRTSVPPPRTNRPQVLIVTGLTPGVLSLLRTIADWRSRFDIVCAYVMDATWPLTRQYEQTFGQMDLVFMPMTGNAENYRSIGVRAEMVPYACDVAKFGPGSPSRLIDVIGYGRQYANHADIIQKTYNAPTSPRMYYHTSYFSRIEVHDHAAQRAVFWKILKRSRIALAYDMLVATTPNFAFSMVAQRWFECLTAGCVVVGRRPTCPEVDTLLDWEDATIEVPEDSNELIPFLEDLLESPDKMDAIHVRNRRETARRHDWRHRIDEMLGFLELERPERLLFEISRLRDAATKI